MRPGGLPRPGPTRQRMRPGGRVRTAPHGFSMETPHYVETLYRAETFSPHSMFYFRAMQSLHDNRRLGAHSRDGTSRTVPGSTTLPLAFRPSRRRPGAVTLPRAGLPDNAAVRERRAISCRGTADIAFP